MLRKDQFQVARSTRASELEARFKRWAFHLRSIANPLTIVALVAGFINGYGPDSLFGVTLPGIVHWLFDWAPIIVLGGIAPFLTIIAGELDDTAEIYNDEYSPRKLRRPIQFDQRNLTPLGLLGIVYGVGHFLSPEERDLFDALFFAVAGVFIIILLELDRRRSFAKAAEDTELLENGTVTTGTIIKCNHNWDSGPETFAWVRFTDVSGNAREYTEQFMDDHYPIGTRVTVKYLQHKPKVKPIFEIAKPHQRPTNRASG